MLCCDEQGAGMPTYSKFAAGDSDAPRIQTRPQRRPPPQLNTFLSTVFTDVATKTRFADPGLMSRWGEIAGPELAALGRPGRILGGTRGATMEVFAAGGAAAARLQFESEALRRRVNQFLGPERIGRIQIRQAGGADAAPVDSALSRFRSSIRSKDGA